MEATTIISVQYFKGEDLAPNVYSYKTSLDLPIGLDIYVPVRNTHTYAKVTNVIPLGEAGYEEALNAMHAKGFGMNKIREITGDDLVVSLIKAQGL